MMKPLSPSYSTSVASTSTSYEGATGSCLVGVLRRIFRSSSLPEFPVRYASAKAEESGNRKEEEEIGAQAATPVPGIVARLMGLESLPQIMKIHGENSPGSVTRSRSMNDLDYREKCEEDGDPRSSIKSTSSFRETPTYLEIENEEFLVLIFENGTETEDGTGSGKRKRRKRRRNRTSILMKNDRNSRGDNSAVEQTPEPEEISSLAKLRNVTSNQQEVVPMDKQAENECSSENSLSPVSVLELSEFVTSDLETSTSDECTAEDTEASNERGDRNLLHTQRSRRSGTGSRRKDISRQPSYLEMQIPSCSWEILSRNGKWKYEEASADICEDVGEQISEELIDDLIVQLSCTSSKNSKFPRVEPPY